MSATLAGGSARRMPAALATGPTRSRATQPSGRSGTTAYAGTIGDRRRDLVHLCDRRARALPRRHVARDHLHGLQEERARTRELRVCLATLPARAAGGDPAPRLRRVPPRRAPRAL